MKLQNTIDNDIFIMSEAVDIIEHHFASDCIDQETQAYATVRVTYIKAGIIRYQETGGQDGSIVSSLTNLFGALYDHRPDHIDGVIWTDIKDELSRIVHCR